jgi:succinate dehydrogenase / fumarate reductase cytochrome b subunit
LPGTEEKGLKLLLRALSSSVGKKFVMAITGLLLCLFLVAHLGGNLLLYVGPQAYNSYAHGLHSQEWLVKIAEVILLILFVTHIYLAVRTTQENRSARNHSYLVKHSKLDAAPHTTSWPMHPEAWMFWSGAIVLGFLLLHLSEFTWEIRLRGQPGEEPFDKAVRILRDNVTSVVYLVGTLILGVHLWHGFASAFQSLGVSHPRYKNAIKWAGVVFAGVIGLGFASFVFLARMLTGSPGGP